MRSLQLRVFSYFTYQRGAFRLRIKQLHINIYEYMMDFSSFIYLFFTAS